VQFQIVTPRNLKQFRGGVLVLPNVKLVGSEEAADLRSFVSRHGHVVLTGATDPQLDSLASATRFPEQPEVAYLTRAEHDFSTSDPASEPALLNAIRSDTDIRISASKNVVEHEARIGEHHYLFFANFDGLKAGEISTSITQRDIVVIASRRIGKTLHWLPFLGTDSVIQGSPAADGMRFEIPRLERGAVAWFTTD
jgi:hypothetical protein